MSSNPAHLQQRYLQIGVAAIASLAVIGVIAANVADSERLEGAAVFTEAARARATSLQEHFRNREDLVGTVEAFFESSETVTPEELARFLAGVPLHSPEVRGVYWLPARESVPRIAYSYGTGCSGDIEPHLIRLATEALARHPEDGHVMGRAGPSGPCRIEGGNTYLLAGLVDALAGAPDGARESVGVVILALDVGAVVDDFYRSRPGLHERATLTTTDAAGRENVLYDRAPDGDAIDATEGERRVSWAGNLTVGGQPLRLVITPTGDSLALANQDRWWQIALFGFLVVGGLAVYSLRRTRDAASLAAVNVELRQLNTRLEEEMEERHRREEELLQARKMEAMGRLAGGIAHDFNNLLTAIRGYAEIITLGQEPGQRGDANEIISAADSAARLTRQLLTFSRRDVVEPQAIDLAMALRELTKMLGRLLGSDVELVTDLEPSLPPVFIDPSHLQQVVINLAVNARDAMPEGGRLTIAARAAGPDQLELEVTDTGHGMTPEVLERIFEPFFTTKRRDRGTGLGLATVYGIVTQSGGSIRAESSPGAGARFHVLLPAAQGHARVAPSLSEPERRGGGETILLVEDRDDVRRLTCRILEREGYHVVAAADPATALLAGDDPAQRIDLLIADLGLPQMSGVEVARRLRQKRPRLKTMFISGYQGELLGERLGSEEMEVLAKPFTATDLLARVRARIDAG